MEGRGNLVSDKQELNQPRESGSFFNYDPLEVQKIPRYSNESLVQQTRDMVNDGRLPKMIIGEFTEKAFRDAVQHTINKPDSERGDSGDCGREKDPGFYRPSPGGEPTDNQNNINKHPGQPPMESPHQNGNKADGQKPPTDKEPFNEHHNENKPPANPDKPKPGLTCEDLENAGGKLPPSKMPPRRCPDFFFENPVKPR